MPKIKKIVARQILDSRGNPTVEADVLLDDAPAIPAKVMQVRIALPSALLNNALLGAASGVPQDYDFFNGADPDAVILAALDKTRAALAEEYGSDDVATWRAPIAASRL